ncbi:flagellar biosynthesis protein [Roseburia intestinalis]|nr:flagellar biosynthesis protein [Roseburia intestinalis]RHG30531.1 flagellar biosynthesis protein [Roseburia intestinalis]
MTAVNEKAEQILSQARAQADVLIDDARQEAEAIRDEAKKQGYLEGQNTLEQEYNQKKQQLEQEQQQKKIQLQNSYQEKQKNMEKELVDVILNVFNKVFHIQFDDKKEILLHLINNAIANIEDEKHFRIKVAGDNVSFLEKHKDEILDYVGHDIELEIVPDYTLNENACTIETDAGIFDCGVDVQLDNLMKDIKALCS